MAPATTTAIIFREWWHQKQFVPLSLSAAHQVSSWLPTQAVAYLPGNGACTVVVDERVLVNHDECLSTRVDCLKTCTLYVLRAPPPPSPLGSKLPISQTAPTASPMVKKSSVLLFNKQLLYINAKQRLSRSKAVNPASRRGSRATLRRAALSPKSDREESGKRS